MTGTIPDGLYNLSNLINLQIGMNLFTGSISSNIGTFHHLAGLYLFENSFGGTIPTEIGLTKLSECIHCIGLLTIRIANSLYYVRLFESL